MADEKLNENQPWESQADCVFCRIVAGREPSSAVHDDELSLGFMALHPTRPGELVVIPKRHRASILDLPDNLAGHLFAQALRLGRTLRSAVGAPRVGVVVNGFAIPHAHLIVVPQHEHHDITSSRFAYLENGHVRFDCDRVPAAARAELDRLAAAIRSTDPGTL